MNIKKYLIGFAVFFAYYLMARQIENRLAIVQKLSGAA
jgi:hypothetical protein